MEHFSCVLSLRRSSKSIGLLLSGTSEHCKKFSVSSWQKICISKINPLERFLYFLSFFYLKQGFCQPIITIFKWHNSTHKSCYWDIASWPKVPKWFLLGFVLQSHSGTITTLILLLFILISYFIFTHPSCS